MELYPSDTYNRRVFEFLLAFAASAIVALLLIRSAHLHGQHSGDHDFDKPQGFHAMPVPRIGGLAVLVGVSIAPLPVAWQLGTDAAQVVLVLLGCSMAAFLAGFIQDFTEAIAPKGRLMATGVSAAAAFYWLDAGIVHTGIPGLDWLVGTAVGSLMVTLLAVAGIANAVNIIDGLNGLAAMCVMLILGAFVYVAYQVGDALLGSIALATIGSVLGLFLWNYPKGLIFLGDGGAYLLGFLMSELFILLLKRHPGEVSPLFPLLACIYPIFETLFSIYRRWVLRSTLPSTPDGIHLHSLVFRRVMRWVVGDDSVEGRIRRNSMASPYLWLLCFSSVVPAVLFWDNTPLLAVALLAFVASYVSWYWRIVRFKSPRWMVPRSRRPRR